MEYHSSLRTDPVIGIDFGTSNSCVAVWVEQENRSKVLKNSLDSKTTPSSLSFIGSGFGETLVGSNGDKAGSGPLICGVKSFLGLSSSKLLNNNNNLLEHGENKRHFIKCKNGAGETKLFPPEEIASHILKALKDQAEPHIRKIFNNPDMTIRRAVIGAPANFTEDKKQSLKAAAYSAGFEEVSFLTFLTA